METLNHVLEKKWDVIIVGSGIGGLVSAYNLLESGFKVLVIEKGKEVDIQSKFLPIVKEKIKDTVNKKEIHPLIGECVGGSSRLFGMVMERFEETDFEDHQGLWPSSLKEWENDFLKAEGLFGVTPAKSVPELNQFLQLFQSKGLEIFPPNLSCKQVKDCNYCQGYVCEKKCKQDAFEAIIEKIKSNQNFSLLSSIEVIKLNQINGQVKSVLIKNNGQFYNLFADRFILAAGALNSPLILKRSENLSNKISFHQLESIGHYLMRHLVDLYQLTWPDLIRYPKDLREKINQSKSWNCKTYYAHNGQKLGTIQAFGSFPSFDFVWEEMKETHKILNYAPFLYTIVKKAFDDITNYPFAASIIEDSPNFSNFVTENSAHKIQMYYKVSVHDNSKILMMRKIIKNIFNPHIKKSFYEAHNNFRLAHICGTCRMGKDVKNSVCDQWGKVHHSENLWITDASAFPASTGKNPALGIAAHALRTTTNID